MALTGCGGVDVVLGEDGEQEQDGHDEDRDRGVEDLDGDVLVELPGHLVGALAGSGRSVQRISRTTKPPTMMPVVIIPE